MTAPTQIIRLTFYRIRPGEYRAPAKNCVTYFIDAKTDLCDSCDHSSQFWAVSIGGMHLGRAPKLKEAKAIANRHAIAAGYIDGPSDE